MQHTKKRKKPNRAAALLRRELLRVVAELSTARTRVEQLEEISTTLRAALTWSTEKLLPTHAAAKNADPASPTFLVAK